ncbi:hypothetical protein [Paenibacillus sp. R14(2021)]|uniref:hypothetical protein n=1 Tax=Paenibacillus sp. R14(2021) TaxID=2859228 RepID=UPI001C614C8B|nr:hypothetical protein [Paenibacillus sp. R14(2021)]
MEIYTPSKTWIPFGLLLFCLAILPIIEHTIIDVIMSVIVILTGIFFILFGLGKISKVELTNEYLTYYNFFRRVKKWRVKEIYLVSRMKKHGNTIFVYIGTESITLHSYSDQFLNHLESIAKNAKVRR